ncbi:hypothetical protein K435DRAFT_781626 [Dendrothele bispora CBS 962.96]|uniref:TEA domain-containing protein n=1 Tax=Dendrothele bispora (strain CBS 962.96) TaxID=1314807 RepID=A0A4S8LJS3_DENBC|nr:hypothetical protein K435DRAFT_781626 [Dendrothele bispora CBS 962.96]
MDSASVDDGSANQETTDVFRSVFKGRKCWKTQKGGEMVWPPELEAALLEGLAKYQPDNSRETVLLGRYPMRNRFISEYILRTTGKHRTAKQVGSRLQQLRDTCNAKELQHLLSPIRKPNAPISNRAQYSCLKRYGLSDASPSFSEASLPGSPDLRTEGDSYSHKSVRPVFYTINIVPGDHCSTMGLYGDNYQTSNEAAGLGGLTSGQPRPIRAIDPTLVFTSSSEIPMSGVRSMFRVFKNEATWREEASVPEPLDPSNTPLPDMRMYTVSFSKDLWEAICQSEDPTKLTIYHNILRDNPNASTPFVLFTAVYKFRYGDLSGASLSSSSTSNSTLRSSAAAAADNGLSMGLYTIDGGDASEPQSNGVSQGFPQDMLFSDMTLQNYPGYDFTHHDGWGGSVPTTPSSSEDNNYAVSRNPSSYYRASPERFSHCRSYRDDSSDSLSPVSSTFPNTTYLPHYTN